MSSDDDDHKEEATVKHSPNLMRGMKIRDEFICPITYELMREPVVASDGHTYEKHAIEKWLKTNHTSPRSGEPMDSVIIPNINLKKLIQDIINEVNFLTFLTFPVDCLANSNVFSFSICRVVLDFIQAT